MSDEEIIEQPDKKNKRTGSVQPPLDGAFSKWIERHFRDGESPQSIDCYPLYKGRDREQRLSHYDVKADESVDAERSVELANEIYSHCQLHCDKLPRNALSREGTKTFEVALIDERRGGQASPVGTFPLKLMPRIHAPAPSEDDDSDLSSEDGDALSARKMILEVHKENTGRQERTQAGTLAVVGETMLLLKESLRDSFVQNRELHGAILHMITEQREMIKAEGQRRVEEKAVAIDAANAEVEREARRAVMAKENMWTDVQRAGVLEAIRVVGQLIPGFGQLGMALISGRPIPSPPQLSDASSNNGTTSSSRPQLPAPQSPTLTQPQLDVPEEKRLIDRFIEAVEKHKIDETHTAAEKLFGKDDENGKPIEAGIFTREQVAILTGVHMGALDVKALDALMMDSGKSEALRIVQLAQAMAYLTPAMTADITRFMELRKAARDKR
jgi:hypothetical protein